MGGSKQSTVNVFVRLRPTSNANDQVTVSDGKTVNVELGRKAEYLDHHAKTMHFTLDKVMTDASQEDMYQESSILPHGETRRERERERMGEREGERERMGERERAVETSEIGFTLLPRLQLYRNAVYTAPSENKYFSRPSRGPKTPQVVGVTTEEDESGSFKAKLDYSGAPLLGDSPGPLEGVDKENAVLPQGILVGYSTKTHTFLGCDLCTWLEGEGAGKGRQSTLAGRCAPGRIDYMTPTDPSEREQDGIEHHWGPLVALEGEVLVCEGFYIGGWTPKRSGKKAWMLDPLSGGFTPLADSPAPLFEYAHALMGDTVHFISVDRDPRHITFRKARGWVVEGDIAVPSALLPICRYCLCPGAALAVGQYIVIGVRGRSMVVAFDTVCGVVEVWKEWEGEIFSPHGVMQNENTALIAGAHNRTSVCQFQPKVFYPHPDMKWGYSVPRRE
ncbi:hypothetical protein KIPB_000513 [Kipferlia bialata]|uniref:Uncharacterized protein n=1 Tax=Kipferlia bialata TaxID=797122 RepID=A0A9K3GDI7_9EUKA|nr:hypothetical protein KIPB_000513 [Kipferlia bialata]|eukprot:g513.t1